MRLEVGGTRQQIVLAMLLISGNTAVTTDRLLEAIYGESLPPTSRAQVQISISSLRRLFAKHTSDEIISTREHGYAIRVDTDALDSAQFEALTAAARAARDAGRHDQAVACYHDALRLWRGPALDGIDSELVQAAASRLNELRIAANEDRLTLELDLGRHRELIGELTELVHEFPLREQLRALLMLALYRSDRAAEALEVYRRARQSMVDELGMEPGDALQKLEHSILVGDPSLKPQPDPIRPQAVGWQIPNLLPTDIADFTGRVEQLGQITGRLLGKAARRIQSPVPVVVIGGKGGIGKTSVAIRAAHSVAGHFTDGLLFADLHGASSNAVHPMQVLERFLRALGVPAAQMPEGLDERAEVYRGLIADKKILVVLDDAASEGQVSPLLPGGGAAGMIITSRRRLTGLAGASHIQLDVFDPEVSLDLLARIAGAARVRAEPTAAIEVVRHCGSLPLALRIAGARLAARPHWTIQNMVDRLADETRRLDELRHGDMGIRPSIMLAYQNVTEEARRLLRRLAVLDVPIFSGWLSAALLDQPLAAAEDVLDDLISAQLVESVGGAAGVHSQYRFHDLIRVFARERLAAEESPAERKAALERALGALLFVVDNAHSRYFGGDYARVRCDAPRWPLPARLVEQLIIDPLQWYDLERVMLVSGVKQAAKAGLVELSWGLACSTVPLFEARVYLGDWRETHDIALAAARKSGNVRGQAAMLNSIGSFHLTQQRTEEARAELTEAAELFDEVGDEQGKALAMRDLAYLDRLSGRLDDAVVRYEQGLAVFRGRGDRIATAYALHGLAQVRLELNQPDSAKELLTEALMLCQAARCGRVEAQVLHRLGEAHLAAGELAAAVDAFERSLTITTGIGDLVGQAYAQQGIGVARLRRGEFNQAGRSLQHALQLAVSARERLVEARALLGLGELALAAGDPGQAVEVARQASQAFRDMGAQLYDVRVLALLGAAHAVLGDTDAAAAVSTEAAELRTKLLDDVGLPRRPAARPTARVDGADRRRWPYTARQPQGSASEPEVGAALAAPLTAAATGAGINVAAAATGMAPAQMTTATAAMACLAWRPGVWLLISILTSR